MNRDIKKKILIYVFDPYQVPKNMICENVFWELGMDPVIGVFLVFLFMCFCIHCHNSFLLMNINMANEQK